jgi:hypothetical protein
MENNISRSEFKVNSGKVTEVIQPAAETFTCSLPLLSCILRSWVPNTGHDWERP